MRETDFVGKMLQIEDDLREYEQLINDYAAFVEEMRVKYGHKTRQRAKEATNA